MPGRVNFGHELEDIPARFRIDQRKHFRLTKHDPTECCGLSIEKAEAETLLTQGLSVILTCSSVFTRRTKGRCGSSRG
jgi:hypothetical protein